MSKRGRDARTGLFVTLPTTVRRPSTTVVETVKPKPTPKPNKKS